LLLTWGLDITSQLAMAQLVGNVAGLPHTVGSAMGTLLAGNVQKVMISIIVWSPYLLVSERVNLTYRMRSAA
jgi:hypothetical protein